MLLEQSKILHGKPGPSLFCQSILPDKYKLLDTEITTKCCLKSMDLPEQSKKGNCYGKTTETRQDVNYPKGQISKDD